MLKNVICDMGNVLMYWDPKALSRVASSDPADAAIFEKELFTSPEWSKNDLGVYDEGELFALVEKRIPDRLKERYHWLIKNWQDYVKPIPGALEFLKYVKGKGLKAYMLSNAPQRFPDCVKDKYELFSLLDGIVVSWHAKAAKPDPRVYRIALEQFGIEASQSVFIDDVEANVEAARNLGMAGYLFDGDYDKLKGYLAQLGV